MGRARGRAPSGVFPLSCAGRRRKGRRFKPPTAHTPALRQSHRVPAKRGLAIPFSPPARPAPAITDIVGLGRDRRRASNCVRAREGGGKGGREGGKDGGGEGE